MNKILLIFLLIASFVSCTAYADNMGATEGVGKTIATDTIATVEYQRMKCTVGVDGVAVDVSRDAGMPVRTDSTLQFDATSAADITNTTSTELKAAGGASVRNYVETFTVSNSDATVGTVVQLLDGATVRYQCPAGALYGGCSVTFPTPLRGSANTAWNCKALTTSAEVRCSISGKTFSE